MTILLRIFGREFLNKNKGMSLTEMMVAVAITGAVSLGTLKFVDLQTALQKDNDIMFEINTIASIASTLMAKKEICEGTFSGTLNVGTNIACLVPVGETCATKARLEAGQTFNNNQVELTSMIISEKTPLSSEQGTYLVKVDFTISKIGNTDKLLRKKTEHVIPVYSKVAFDENGQFARCQIENEKAINESMEDLSKTLLTVEEQQTLDNSYNESGILSAADHFPDGSGNIYDLSTEDGTLTTRHIRAQNILKPISKEIRKRLCYNLHGLEPGEEDSDQIIWDDDTEKCSEVHRYKRCFLTPEELAAAGATAAPLYMNGYQKNASGKIESVCIEYEIPSVCANGVTVIPGDGTSTNVCPPSSIDLNCTCNGEQIGVGGSCTSPVAQNAEGTNPCAIINCTSGTGTAVFNEGSIPGGQSITNGIYWGYEKNADGDNLTTHILGNATYAFNYVEGGVNKTFNGSFPVNVFCSVGYGPVDCNNFMCPPGWVFGGLVLPDGSGATCGGVNCAPVGSDGQIGDYIECTQMDDNGVAVCE